MKYITYENLVRLLSTIEGKCTVRGLKRIQIGISNSSEMFRIISNHLDPSGRPYIATYLALKGLFRNCDSILIEDAEGSLNLVKSYQISYESARNFRKNLIRTGLINLQG